MTFDVALLLYCFFMILILIIGIVINNMDHDDRQQLKTSYFSIYRNIKLISISCFYFIFLNILNIFKRKYYWVRVINQSTSIYIIPFKNKHYERDWESVFGFPSFIAYDFFGSVIEKRWYKNNVIHRDNNYASIVYDKEYGSKTMTWYDYSKVHRDYGPCVIIEQKNKIIGSIWGLNGNQSIELNYEIHSWLTEKNIVITLQNQEIPDEHKAEFKLRFH